MLEFSLDRITRLAATVFQVPIVRRTFVDAELFPVEPSFEGLLDGSLIRVIRLGSEYVSVMHVTRLSDPVLVQFGPFLAMRDWLPPATSDQEFVATGHSGLPVHKLTLEEPRGTKRTSDTEVPFALTILQS